MTTPHAFATVITRTYLAHARVLAARLREYDEAPLYVLCVDEPHGFFDPTAEPFHVVRLEDVLPVHLRGMAFYYTPFELCNSLKPFLQRWVFAHTSHDKVLCLDADIFPYGSLAPACAALDDADILLSPHLLNPCPPAHVDPLETLCLRYGIYNGGYVGLRRSDEATRFIDWLSARTATHGFQWRNGSFVDQLWLNFAPAYFQGVAAWKHPGANVANWNLHERTLRRSSDGITVNNAPLLFAHMSYWKFDHPADWTLGRPVAEGTDMSVIAEIGTAYRDALVTAGYETVRRWPYGFGTFANGRPITVPMRRDYFDRIARGALGTESPFEHPEWFRGPLRYVEWRRFVPLALKRLVRTAIE